MPRVAVEPLADGVVKELLRPNQTGQGLALDIARVGIGGAEARPRRIAEAEAILQNRPPELETFRAAAEAAAGAIDPI